MRCEQYVKYIQQICQQYLKIACDQYGCRILEYLYKKVDSVEEHETCAPLLKCLEDNCKTLAAHKFGNYLVQAALRNKFY